MPDPVATHWGTDGVDGFGSLASALTVPLIIGGLFTVLMWAFAWHLGKVSSTRRVTNGFAVWLAVFLSVVTLGPLHAQKGLTDAADVAGIGGVIALALAAATVCGILAAVLTPAGSASPTTDPVPADAIRLALGADERAVWFQRVHSSTGVAVGAAVGAASMVTAVWLQDWWMLTVTAALLALAASMFSWVVRVDETGVSIRSALGVPRTHIPLDEIVEARSTTVRCFRDFGGCGWRTAIDGRTGVVIRSGDALEVTRTGGGIFVVTVDDAATATALLNTLAERSRPGHTVE